MQALPRLPSAGGNAGPIPWASPTNTKALDDGAARVYLEKMAAEHYLPATDPVRYGVEAIIDALERTNPWRSVSCPASP